MELTVRSLQGSYIVSGVESEATLADLKRMLHQQHQQQVPEPEEQCLVFRHSLLSASDAVLQQLGITHGDQLVMLPSRPTIKRPRAQTTPAADTAAIRTAITEEARSRGLEHTLKEERPPAARRRLPAGILNAGNEQLLQLLQQAFDGQLPGLQLNVSGAGQAGEDAEAEEDEGEVQVPEPQADRITQLTEMGFSDTLARNALLLQRSNVEAALEWLLEHGDDPAGAEPIPEDRLRQIYGRRRGRAAGVRVSLGGLRPEDVLAQLTDMGFESGAAQSVLSQVGPSLELAVQILLGGRGASAAGAAAGNGAASAAGAAGSLPGSAARSARQSPQPPEAAAGAEGDDADPDAQHISGGTAAAAGAEGLTSEAEAESGAEDDGDAGDEDEFEDGDEDEFEDDEDEDDFFDNTDDALYDLPIGGTMQLANLGSADMEQLLQGANLQELTLGNQLLMPGGMDTGMAGPQATLLRLLDSPAFLEQVAAGMQVLQGADQVQQQQEQQQRQQARQQNQQAQQQLDLSLSHQEPAQDDSSS